MENYKIVEYSNKFKNKFTKVLESFNEVGENFAGTGSLKDLKDFENWHNLIKTGKEKQLLFIDSQENIIGLVNIRINEENGKNIGYLSYSILPSYRGKGLATQELFLATEKAKTFGVDEIIIACGINNLASKRAILSSGGEMQEQIKDENNVLKQKYSIKIKKT